MDPEDKELCWPKGNPRAMSEKAIRRNRLNYAIGKINHDSQHAVRFIPTQLLLDIDGSLSLDRKADQTQEQEECGISIFPAGRKFSIIIWASASEC